MGLPAPGDYGVARGGGWPMWWIRLGTFSRYGHAAVMVDGPRMNPGVTVMVQVVEAMPSGARRRWCAVDEFVWSRCPITPTQRHAIVGLAVDCVGLPYDWRDITGFIGRFFGAKIRGRSDDHADDRMICSELVTYVYRTVGHEVAPSAAIAIGDVSPGDLAEHITRGEIAAS